MNVFILTDLEGISGVCDIEYMDRENDKYKVACGFLTESINLAVQTCIECGTENVYYLDGHGGGGNVFEDKVDRRAVKCDIGMWQDLLSKGRIDCQIELGSHARAGTLNGFLDHTMTSRQWFCHKVNGMDMSELSLHALLCASYKVPVVCCTGDEAACSQAKEYIPNIYTGAVKKAIGRNHAVMYENAEEIIRQTIKDALKNYKEVSFFKIEEPSEMELTFYRSDMCDDAFEHCGAEVERINARTLRKTVEKIIRYEDLKFERR